MSHIIGDTTSNSLQQPSHVGKKRKRGHGSCKNIRFNPWVQHRETIGREAPGGAYAEMFKEQKIPLVDESSHSLVKAKNELSLQEATRLYKTKAKVAKAS